VTIAAGIANAEPAAASPPRKWRLGIVVVAGVLLIFTGFFLMTTSLSIK
jgi:hypothetical protein